jgi:hypothetical protein
VTNEGEAVAGIAPDFGFGSDRLGAHAHVSQRLAEVREQSGPVADGEIFRPRGVNHSVLRDGDEEVLETSGCDGNLCREPDCWMLAHGSVRRHCRKFMIRVRRHG